MAYTSGFFDAVDQGSGNYDRVYSAADFSHYFGLLVKNGVFPDPSTGLQVVASSAPDMHVAVKAGNGWINGYYLTIPEGDSELLTVPTANPSLSRIDSVIMGLNYTEREIQLYVKSGSVSSSPSPVSLQRDNDLYELELARITLQAGAASITQSMITDARTDSSRCGIVTGLIENIDTTDLFAQYDDAFQTWFEDLKGQLSGDVAANLQNQINELSETTENLIASIGKSKKLVAKITSSQVFRPSDYGLSGKLVDVFLCAGGGGGAGGSGTNTGGSWQEGGQGGQGGQCRYLTNIPLIKDEYNLVVGSGGTGGSGGTSSSLPGSSGTSGGDTSGFGFTVKGGAGGKGDNVNVNDSVAGATKGGAGGDSRRSGGDAQVQEQNVFSPENPYETDVFGGAGGGGAGPRVYNDSERPKGGKALLNGGDGADGSTTTSSSGADGVDGSPATGYGGGGGGGSCGVLSYQTNRSGGKGGDGSPGAILVYAEVYE